MAIPQFQHGDIAARPRTPAKSETALALHADNPQNAPGTDRIATSEVVSELIVMEERPWADWRRGRPLSAQSVAKHMKPFGIKKNGAEAEWITGPRLSSERGRSRSGPLHRSKV